MAVKTGAVVRETQLPVPMHAAAVVRIGRRLLVSGGWASGVQVFDLDHFESEPERIWLAAGMPDYMASHGDEIWTADWFAPAIVRTNVPGELLDWAEPRFGLNPLAWDGEHLWVLDREGKRICTIEKTALPPDADA